MTVTDELTYYAEGEPLLADALVEIRNALLPGSPTVSAVSDSAGIAVIPSVPEGTYNVRVSWWCVCRALEAHGTYFLFDRSIE